MLMFPFPHADRPSPTDHEIYSRVFDAILERRLRPGARLGEERLANFFGVSRTKIRQALTMLAQDGVVEIRRNQGASVATPTPAQVREVFQFRRILEPALAATFASAHEPSQTEILRTHVFEEDAARSAGNLPKLILLTGQFHLLLAQLVGNPLICTALKEMEALTCLAILQYARTDAAACPADHHAEILAAMAAQDGEKAARLMMQHLDHVEAEMDLTRRADDASDLATALGRTAA